MIVWAWLPAFLTMGLLIEVPYLFAYQYYKFRNASRFLVIRSFLTWIGIGLIFIGFWQLDWALIGGTINSAIEKTAFFGIELRYLDLYNYFFASMFFATVFLALSIVGEQKRWSKQSRRLYALAGLFLLGTGLYFIFKICGLPPTGVGLSTTPYLFVGFFGFDEIKVLWIDYALASILTVLKGIFVTLMALKRQTTPPT